MALSEGTVKLACGGRLQLQVRCLMKVCRADSMHDEADGSAMAGRGPRTAEVHLLGMAARLRKLRSMLNACLFNPILNCCFKYVDSYIC